MNVFKTTPFPRARVRAGIKAADLLTEIGMTDSRGEAKHLIKSGAVYVGGDKIDSLDRLITLGEMAAWGQRIRVGKQIQDIVLTEDE
jgi:tyrosyl-tRNA synthetase